MARTLGAGRQAQDRRDRGGAAYLTNDMPNDPEIGDRDWARREGIVAFARYPLMVEDRQVGVMAMFAREPLPRTLEMLASVADDIAQGVERRQAEAALREDEVRYRSVIAALEEAITVHDAEGAIRACNASAEPHPRRHG